MMTNDGSTQGIFSRTCRGFGVVLAACFVFLLPLNTFADPLYVSDNLRVGVRDSAENNASTLTVINSGSQVELLERSGSFIKVRTADGVEGWVKSAYFSKSKPARVLLNETKSQLLETERELKKLRASNTADTPQLAHLNAEINRLKERETDLQRQLQNVQLQNKAEIASSPNAPVSLRELISMNNKALLIGIASLIVFLCLGFLIGVSWHKRQVTKRLGGLTL